MRFFFIVVFWIVSLIAVSIYTYENPEKIERIKYFYKKNKDPGIKVEKSKATKVLANSFSVEYSKTISLSEKTAFIMYRGNNLDFDENKLKIYTQNGHLINNLESKKLRLSKNFTMERNGGIKTIFTYNKEEFALISSSNKNCYYASIIFLASGKEIFKTKCLPDKYVDFNGLGSSSVHIKDKIYLSLGAPEQRSPEIRALAQDNNSKFGKILEISKKDLESIIRREEVELDLKIFTLGHRNPQGMTKINKSIFSAEHGPKGGDELNKIIEGKNYGWPEVSYGTKYMYEEEGKYFKINHEKNDFAEPLFALTPSVGISSINTCPTILKKYYNKPCLIALSLFGNNLRPGRSLIIFLLAEDLNKVHSVEQIYVGDDLKFRHFVTNSKNELYEDKEGKIYVSADKKGIYELSFLDFRK